MKVFVEAYGCTQNKGEAAQIEAKLRSGGYEIVEAPESASTVVLHTCVVIKHTENQMLKRIKEHITNGRKVVVAGCITTTNPEVLEDMENVDVLELGHYDAIYSILPPLVDPPAEIESASLDGPIGILPISMGCIGACTYCITRLARGPLNSYPIEDLVKEAEALVKKGAKELRVTSQDTAAYGMDTGTSLPELLARLTAIEGDFMIRVGMMTPWALSKVQDGLIDAYKDPKIFKFIHLPVQSGSDAVLKRMGRKNTVAGFEGQIKALRSAHSSLALSTDIIVGFPGETEEDFQASMELIERLKPDIVNITRFSPRPGTPASDMPDQIVEWCVKERSRALTELRHRLSGLRYSEYIGKTVRVLAVEERKEGSTLCRTDDYRPVVVLGEVPLGTRVRAKIDGATTTYLVGKKI